MAEKKPNLKTVLIIAGIAGYILMLFVLNPYIQKQEKPKEKVENKVVYIPSDITKKYPKDFADKKELIKKIKAQIANEYQSINEGKQTSTYKDSNGRVVYIKIEEIKAVKNFLGGKSGYSFKRYYPDEEGYLYDAEGKVIKKIEIKSSYESCYFVSSLDDIKRKSYFEDEETGATLRIVTMSYDEKGNKIKEERVNPSSWYEKEITEYSKGKKKTEKKIIDYEVDAEQYNKIYVEITKEYDENEKLIKKFVLRKNKFNSIRSETNFDLIKGEIITKYYDGEKAFATVTETLIGKDRAIVKRERVGDEFVIWDFYKYGKFKDTKDYILSKHDRFIVKNGKITLKFENIQEWGTEYNNNQNGIEKINFFYEHIVSDEDSDYIGWIDNLEKIKEYDDGKVFKSWKVIEQKNIRKQYRIYNFDLEKIEKDLEIVSSAIQENNIEEVIKKFREDI